VLKQQLNVTHIKQHAVISNNTTRLKTTVLLNVIPRLHEEAYMKHTWSKLRAHVVHSGDEHSPRTLLPPARTFSPAFLHTRTFPLMYDERVRGFLPRVWRRRRLAAKCCTAALSTWRRPTSYRRC